MFSMCHLINATNFLHKFSQAIRIEVNQELEVLKEMLEQSKRILKKKRKFGYYFLSS